MKDKITFVDLSWDIIEAKCNYIYEQMIADNYCPDTIIGLSRGGVVPARIFSDRFHIVNNLFFLDVKSYNGINKSNNAPIVGQLSLDSISGKVLIVDDIYDSGKTISAVLKFLNKEDVKTVTLLWKETAQSKPDYYADIVKKDEWVVFAWEKFEFKKEMGKR